ncbi:MAG: hypothetical protein Q9196_007195 [Gyalolechia fulgens]
MVHVHEFTRKEADRTILSTEILETLIEKWSTGLSTEFGHDKKEMERLYDLLIEHRSFGLDVFMTMEINDSVMLSITALNERLMAAVMDLHVHLGFETPVDLPWRLRSKDVPDIGRPILDLMRTRGWCPYDLRRLDIGITDVSMLYYYSNLKPPRSSKDHSDCSQERCVTMSTNPATYKPSHRNGCGGCPLLSANQSDIDRILLNGSIPLVTVSQSNIRVHDLEECSEFVAISHVWAEGAGNVNGNALQSCLLEDISGLVKKILRGKGRVAFWIDTLCVPVRPPEMQTLALNKMRMPYERAKDVIVLDSHLRSLNSREMSPTELFAQVSCSSWMRRLWTLQEGRLAENVWFQFADEAINVKIVFEKLNPRRIPSKVDSWLGAAIYVDLWVHIRYRGEAIPNVSQVTNSILSTSHSLRTRSASVPTDEALCLFNLMHMDLTRITMVAPTKRMEVFWRTVEKVPKSLMFSKASKLSNKGIHWAPSSFMGFQSAEDWLGPQELSSPGENDPHAMVKKAGLQLALPALILHQDLVGRTKQFDYTLDFPLRVQDADGLWYLMRVDEPWRQGSDDLNTTKQLAVILARELKTNHSNPQNPYTAFLFQDATVGLIVSIDGIEDDIIQATAHNHVVVDLLGKGHQERFSAANTCVQKVGLEQSTLLSESHVALKERYKTAAQHLLKNKDISNLLEGKARYMGETDDYEHLLDDFLDMTVDTARLGDFCKVQKVAENQEWCVD